MRPLTKEEQEKALELLKEASGFIDSVRFIDGEDVDEDDLEESINSFLNSVKE
jgi:hypothetical protein